MAYDVNYDDQRFKDVEGDKTEALSELESTYSDMVGKSDDFYKAQIDASKQWEKTQTENQQAQTDFAIEQIEQQKQQAEKEYKKEQSGAYKDWKVESNRYGANAETMAQQGMINSGYAESAQVSMYNTYQGRVAQAREVYNTAVMNYNNAIKDARLQNNSVLAQIAYQSLQTQLELSLQGFQYKNQLLLDKIARKNELDQMYYGRYQDVLNQINHEIAFNEQVRQYDQNFAEQVRQYNQDFDEQVRQYDQNFAEQVRQFNESMAFDKEKFEWQKSKSSGSGGGASKKKSSSGGSGASNDAYLKSDDETSKTKSGIPNVDKTEGVNAGGEEPNGYYRDLTGDEVASIVGDVSSFEDAIRLLKSSGKSTSGIYTKDVWEQKKKKGNDTANTYEDYLRTELIYRMLG